MAKRLDLRRRARLPRRWTKEETLAVHRLGLVSHIPKGIAWPGETPDMADILSNFPYVLGDPQADLKTLTLWIGVTHTQWKVDWWRWCFEIRYRYGNYTPIELLGKPWVNRLRASVEVGLESYDNGPILKELDSEPSRPKCLRLLAMELARDCVRAKRNSPAVELEPWKQPVRNKTIWDYLRRTRPWFFDGPNFFKYIEVDDGTQEALIGRILYHLQAAEDWN